MSRSRTIHGPGLIRGTLPAVPGDKSISHRVAILASLAQGSSTIDGFSSGADCLATLNCIERLGISVERSPTSLVIRGRGLRGYHPAEDPVNLNAENSGSTIRMLSGVLAGQHFQSNLDGDSSLRRRPMRRVIAPLEAMGARIHAEGDGLPPLLIRGDKLEPINYSSPISSAQVKSCVLFAGLFARGRTTYTEPAQSRNHTELMLEVFGASVGVHGNTVTVEGPAELTPVKYRVPGDPSSAAFFAAAAAIAPNSEILIRSVNLNPTRMAFFRTLESLGASVKCESQAEWHREPVGDIRVLGRPLRVENGVIRIHGQMVPNIIDELPLVAVLATQADGRVEVRDAQELRVKESDRIQTISRGIKALGGEIEEFEDGFAVNGPQKLTGAKVSADGDHRIAMALSIAGLAANGATEVIDADCVSVSFPEFYKLLQTTLVEGNIE